jgi:hypothetical protein
MRSAGTPAWAGKKTAKIRIAVISIFYADEKEEKEDLITPQRKANPTRTKPREIQEHSQEWLCHGFG